MIHIELSKKAHKSNTQEENAKVKGHQEKKGRKGFFQPKMTDALVPCVLGESCGVCAAFFSTNAVCIAAGLLNSVTMSIEAFRVSLFLNENVVRRIAAWVSSGLNSFGPRSSARTTMCSGTYVCMYHTIPYGGTTPYRTRTHRELHTIHDGIYSTL
jgi:hypothetical protein